MKQKVWIALYRSINENKFISKTFSQRKLEGHMVSLLNSFKCLGKKNLIQTLWENKGGGNTLYVAHFMRLSTTLILKLHIWFVSEMKVWLNIWKAISFIYHFNRIRKKNNIVFSIAVEKVFDKFRYSW